MKNFRRIETTKQSCNRQSYLNSEHEKTSIGIPLHISATDVFFGFEVSGNATFAPKAYGSFDDPAPPACSEQKKCSRPVPRLPEQSRYAVVVALSHDFQWSPMVQVFGTSRNPGEFRTCHFMSFHVTSTCCKFISPALSASNFSLRQNELFGAHDVQDLR